MNTNHIECERDQAHQNDGADVCTRCGEDLHSSAPVAAIGPKIRFIVNTYTSYPDRNGNRESFARVRSTVTGESLSFHTYSASNARALVFKATGGDWARIDSTECDLPIRQWKGAAKGVPYNVELEEIAQLERAKS